MRVAPPEVVAMAEAAEKRSKLALKVFAIRQEHGEDGVRGFNNFVLSTPENADPEVADKALSNWLPPGAFNPTAEEEKEEEESDKKKEEEEEEGQPVPLLEIKRLYTVKGGKVTYAPTGDEMLDHVFGGGLPLHHCLMIAAPPGCGKSTLMRKMAAALAQRDFKCLYASSEETEKKIKGEFARAKLFTKYPKSKGDNMQVISSGDPEAIILAAQDHEVDILIVDSLMMLYSPVVDGDVGKSNQIVHAAQLFMNASHATEQYAEERKMTIILICHATKGGDMSGPNKAKHICDGCFFMEHVDPDTLKPAEDQNQPTGVVKMRVHGKYRCGSPMNYGYYRMTASGLVVYKPKEGKVDRKELVVVKKTLAKKVKAATSSKTKVKTKARAKKKKPPASSKLQLART